ncbi:glycosyltransferase family 4 protein [Methylocaldum sp.]|uniref:glycosyltransferase family 4 protein n=1 Tax=Methylocaldum sp. TaxID=1969727 RepID=UPI002D3FA408|nr:glycosyltransferase family 4 protein [Methylocaldum sp.]HYE35021.1 glycosyltransferase family 4 protein [Methylocaldum sp.]
MPSCLIVVENLPVPLDRRVWQEATALRDAGWQVTVICPATEKYPEREAVIDGIRVYRHPLPLEAKGALGFLLEYGAALFHETRLAFKAFRRHGFDIVHICNPPDLLFLVALPYKALGRPLIFDHHDICPELYESKFKKRGPMHTLLRIFERLTFRFADVVVSANETFKELAVKRGGKHPDDVFTVYSIPDLNKFKRVPTSEAKNTITVGYVGVVGAQDGVDNLIRAVAALRNESGVPGFTCKIVGDGPELPTLKALAQSLGVADICRFTGFLSGESFLAALSSFDIGIIPDPFDIYNDKISMNKVFEYSALGVPIVAFELAETKRLLGNAARYAPDHTPEGLTSAVGALLKDESLRRNYAERALERARIHFHWPDQVATLLAAYDRALMRRAGFDEARAVRSEHS